MSNLFQVLAMMAVPASLLLMFRYLNLRDARVPITRDSAESVFPSPRP